MLDFQFATAWTAEVEDGRDVQILVYLRTEANEDTGHLDYYAKAVSWWRGDCVSFQMTWDESKRDKAYEFIDAVCDAKSEARSRVEKAIMNILWGGEE